MKTPHRYVPAVDKTVRENVSKPARKTAFDSRRRRTSVFGRRSRLEKRRSGRRDVVNLALGPAVVNLALVSRSRGPRLPFPVARVEAVGRFAMASDRHAYNNGTDAVTRRSNVRLSRRRRRHRSRPFV